MHRLAIGGLGLFCLVSVASLFGRTAWVFELLTHFRFQYVVGGVLLALVLLILRRWVGAGVSLVLAAAHAAPIIALLDAPPRADAGARETVRVMTLNLRHRHGDIGSAARLIRAEKPDIVILTELLAAHEPVLDAFRDILPFRIGAHPRGKFDSVLLSRLPITRSRIHYPSSRFLPIIEARLCPEDLARTACLHVIALHAPRPDFARGEAQTKTFALVAELAKSAGRRALVAGDLNTTPYSHRYRDLLARGALTDAAGAAAWRTTWISRWPPFGLPLDHVLVGAGLRPISRRVGDEIGSDHFPVIVDIVIDRNNMEETK